MERGFDRVARVYPWLVGLGLIIVLSGLAIGAFNSQTAAAYYAAGPAAAVSATGARSSFESINQWLPYYQFFGLWLILDGIVLALWVINRDLTRAGMAVMANLPPEQRPQMPSPPSSGPLSLWLAFVGEAILLSALILSARQAALAAQVYANPLPAIAAAGAGSTLLTQLRTIQTINAWLTPFRFLGISTLFVAIVLGLATILHTLNVQTRMLGVAFPRAREEAQKRRERQAEQVPM